MLSMTAEPYPRGKASTTLFRRPLVLSAFFAVLSTLLLADLAPRYAPGLLRFEHYMGDVARVHGVSVDVLVALTLTLVVVLVRVGAPRRVLNVASLTVFVMAAQGVLGYVQYFNRIPAVLVGFHVFGAVCVFTCVQQLLLELSVADDPRVIEAGGGAPARNVAIAG